MNNTFLAKRNPLVIKIFLTVLIPTIFMNLATAIGSMADAVIIGQYLDELSLSVVTYALPVYMVINTTAALFAVGGCISMSVDMGKGDKKAANGSFSLSMEFLILIGIILLLVGFFFSGQVTNLLGASNELVFEQVRTYVRIILCGAPVFIVNIALAFFVRNDGKPSLSMIGMAASILVDIIFNIVFVGVIGMGVEGAAYSTVLGQMIGIIITGSHFFSAKNTLKFRFALNLSIFRIIKNGIGSALGFIYQFVTIIVLNHFVVMIEGPQGMVIFTVVFNLCSVSLAVFEGLSQTIQPMVGVYYGEKSNKKIKASVKLAILSAIVICGSVMVFLEIFPSIIPHIFGITDLALVSKASVAVRIYATSMIITTINVIIGYYLQSIEFSSMASVLISLRCCVLFLISAIVLGIIFGINGIWASYVLAESLTFVIYLIMNFIKRRKLSKENINADLFFLDKKVEESAISLVFECKKDDFDNYLNEVKTIVEKCEFYSDKVADTAICYLSKLKTVLDTKSGKYVEVEFIGCDGKIIIRDNLKHTDVKKEFEKISNDGIESEYGPVLGWNRICLKGVGDIE